MVRVFTELHRKNISKALTGKSLSKEHIKIISNNLKTLWNDPEYRKKQSDERAKRWNDPEYRKKQSDVHKGFPSPNKGKIASEETRKKQREAHLGISLSESHRRNIRLSLIGKKHPPRTNEWKEKQRLAKSGKPSPFKGKSRWTDEQRKHIGDIQRGKKLSEEHRKKISEGNKGRIHTPEMRDKISKTLRGHPVSQNQIEKQRKKIIEHYVNGFWYGNVQYPEQKHYCELWTKELCERIRAAWNYKSVISGKTIIENKGKKLDCHHVYFQEKACCKWDKDQRGFYAMINLGTKREPNIIHYNIKGDPNKFVPLTRSEHLIIRSDKLKWIRYFEDLIEKHGGKCYFTKEEMKLHQLLLTPVFKYY